MKPAHPIIPDATRLKALYASCRNSSPENIVISASFGPFEGVYVLLMSDASACYPQAFRRIELCGRGIDLPYGTELMVYDGNELSDIRHAIEKGILSPSAVAVIQSELNKSTHQMM